MIPAIISDSFSVLKNATLRTFEEVFFPERMTRPEALKILNLQECYSTEELEFNFKKFYSANSQENRGSPYIQSKIENAFYYLKELRDG